MREDCSPTMDCSADTPILAPPLWRRLRHSPRRQTVAGREPVDVALDDEDRVDAAHRV